MSRFLKPVFYKKCSLSCIPAYFRQLGSLTELSLGQNNIGDAGAKELAGAIGASGSLALKWLHVPRAIRNHAELVAACKSKGVGLK